MAKPRAQDDDHYLPSFEEAGNDPKRLAAYLRTCYSLDAWQDVRRPWERKVEETVRMLSGRQHDVYIESLGQFVDIVEQLYGEDEAWRRQPVFNWTAHAYDLALSKLTENMPMMRAMPASADVRDSMLADFWSQIWNYEWDQMGMNLEYWKLYGWALTAGRGIIKLHWDMSKGPMQEFRGPGMVPILAPDGQVYQRQYADAPYILGADGEPVMNVIGVGPDGMPQFGRPHRQRGGDLTAIAINPLGVLFPSGPEPHYRKPWLTYEYFLSPEEVWNRYKVEVEPDEITGSDDLMVRLSYASQYTDRMGGWGTVMPDEKVLRNLCRIREHWRREVVDSEDPDEWFGRTSVTTDHTTLYDGQNPFIVEGQQERAVIPFYVFDVPGYPFRQEGNGPFEFSHPINRAMNRLQGGMLDHAERLAHPARLTPRGAFEEDQDWNRPAQTVEFNPGGLNGQPPVQFEQMPDIPAGTQSVAQQMRDWLMVLTKTNQGGEGNAVTADASGELQREVRFDADRPWGLPLRVHSYEWARMGEDIVSILNVCQTDDRLVTIFGDDQAPVFLDLRQDLWLGRVNVRPSLESQQLESRQDRMNRITAAFAAGLFDPMNPGAAQANELLGQPDIQRVTRPGGRAYERVQREHLELYQGEYPPVLPEHDHAYDLAQHKLQQQTLQYRNAPDEVKQLFRVHIQAHEELGMQQAITNAAKATAVAGAEAGMEADAAQRAVPQGAHGGASSDAGRPGGSASGASQTPAGRPGSSQEE